MKKLFIISTFLSTVAYGQNSMKTFEAPKYSWNYANGLPMKHNPITGELQDTIPGYMHTRGTWIPGDSSISELLPIRFRKVMVQELMMGQKAVYTPETDREGGNGLNQKSKVIVYQIAMDDVVTEEQKEKIKQAIDLIMFNSPGAPVVIDTVDAEVSNFDASWRTGATTAPNWYKNTIAYSNTVNAVATYKHPFEFTKIEIYGEKVTSHGIAGISIDGGPETMVDLYSPTRVLPALLHTFNVPKGMHEIKIRVTGTKNTASTGTYALVDFYKIYR